ncbi:LysR family transcriptional regulator [Methylobacterium sp.]|uniref:LysR family transcriptional regulator n=1 Tax=Methylobacterium sp. TaxID=409 RepID=UPI0025E5AE16|nr:LysR family transcriptional regulator [Methylobacterium sp.]MBY0260079.1 LysR family transcriptional regulator [Methylobacterium sp.]
MINPAHLDLFRAVMRHGGMTRAAEALGIGQPHISRAMAQLEAETGLSLFVRGHGTARPTPEGEAFAREVERSYAGLDHLRHAARQIRELGTGPLRIACQPSLASHLLPRAIQRLVAEHPGARIAVHVPSPDEIWAWTASGRCDLGLARPRTGHAGVTAERFLTVDAVVVLPRRHPLARRRAIGVADLAGESLVAGGPGLFQEAVEARFAEAGCVPRFPLMAQYTAARCGLVAAGLGLAIVDPVPAAELTGLPIVLRPFRPALAIETRLIRPAARPPGRLVERLIDFLRVERDALPSRRTDDSAGPATR